MRSAGTASRAEVTVPADGGLAPGSQAGNGSVVPDNDTLPGEHERVRRLVPARGRMIASGIRYGRFASTHTILVQSRSAAAWMQRSAMTLDLTPDDAQRLRQLLEDYLPDLRREDGRDLSNVVWSIVAALAACVGKESGPSTRRPR